ncbi:TrkA family potassium uptake protein [Halogeometricum borinquense]|uniref:TrkA family potassium uptake protein n=1 Tax=Halogeometricum borinquense TaxID=60847 RepID=A0A6C0UGQ1_9EURY|nr:NAD-binding protein [Halogeometricum borinquense]QIB73743.1 TrkA family potassium uptake protein [Halogeometricum borinquense]QIQ76899.1 TrkA family potassium uptake protein [Halogeometricum borinquense]
MVDGPAETLSGAKRRLVLYLSGVAVLMLGYAALYQWGMATFEGTSVTYIDALHVVVETFTTTGYGEDAARWTTDAMKLITIPMMVSGVTVIFLTLPLFLVPLVEEALRTAPPTTTEQTDHVIICSFTSRGDTLVEELESRGVPYVVVDEDRETAQRLYAEEYEVVHGNPELVDTLEAANAEDAMALVADDDDETNASIILSAKQAAPDLHVISLIEDGTLSDYHKYAGADEVVSPRRILGESLARKAASPIAADIDGAIEIGDDFEVAEVLVQRDSALEGDTIAESAIGRRTGVNIIGAWFRGEFVTPPDPEAVVDEHTILLVTGREEQLERLKELTRSETRRFRRGKVIVAGYGEVGATAADALVSANVPSLVLDEVDKPGVDVIGDATNKQAFLSADIDEAQSVILALDNDTTAIFATLVINQLSPETEVIARANDAESIAKLYRAGAEYVLALSTVSGRILASNLTEEEVIAPESQVEIVRTTAPQIAGQTLAEADVRARTNCTVIAVERNDELLTEVGPDFTIRSEDTLIVAGTDDDINQFNVVCG